MQQIANALTALVGGFFDRLSTDASYREGVGAGLLVAFLIGFISLQVLYWWGRIARFFLPTPRSFVPGPSPSTSLAGCVVSALALLVFVLVIVFAISLIVSPPPG